jgi:hypothetical protein
MEGQLPKNMIIDDILPVPISECDGKKMAAYAKRHLIPDAFWSLMICGKRLSVAAA